MLMDLASGCVITRSRVTEVPVTNAIVHTVERMATKDGIIKANGLKKNKKTQYLLTAPHKWACHAPHI
jgi:hypothetical protein